MSPPSAFDHALAVLFGLLIPGLSALKSRQKSEDDELVPFLPHEKIATYWSGAVSLWVLCALALFAWHWGDRELVELGFRAPGAPAPGLGILLSALLLAAYGFDTWYKATHRLEETRARWRRDTPFMPTDRRQLAHWCVLAVSAGVCEEVVFRGYLISYLMALLGNEGWALVAAIGLPSLTFGLSHLYQGWSGVARIVLGGAAFGAIWYTTGSLWIPVAIHVAVDVFSGFLGRHLIGETVDHG